MLSHSRVADFIDTRPRRACQGLQHALLFNKSCEPGHRIVHTAAYRDRSENNTATHRCVDAF